MTICKVAGCDKNIMYTKTGYCQKHHRKFIRYGDPLAISPKLHGMSGTYEYELWQNIRKKYPVCDIWQLFRDFYKDVGKRPAYGYRLKRINENKEFGPKNFKWVTKK